MEPLRLPHWALLSHLPFKHSRLVCANQHSKPAWPGCSFRSEIAVFVCCILGFDELIKGKISHRAAASNMAEVAKVYGRVNIPELLSGVQQGLLVPVHAVAQAIGTGSMAAAGGIKRAAFSISLAAGAAHAGKVFTKQKLPPVRTW